jgi:hypothetical protein
VEELVMRMLEYDPAQRPGLSEAAAELRKWG